MKYQCNYNNFITLFCVIIIIKIEYYYNLLFNFYIIIMLNNKIQAIITIHHIHPIRKIEIQISHTNIINKIWYILYNIDQIILNNDIAYDKVIDFIESFDDKNNYF